MTEHKSNERHNKESMPAPESKHVLSVDMPVDFTASAVPRIDLETVKFILGSLLQAIDETSTADDTVNTMEGYLQGLITGLEGKCSNATAGEIYENNRQ